MAQLIPPLLIEGDAPPGANPHLMLLTSPRDLLTSPRDQVAVNGARPPRLTRRSWSHSITCSALGAARRLQGHPKGQTRGAGGHNVFGLHNLFGGLLCHNLFVGLSGPRV